MLSPPSLLPHCILCLWVASAPCHLSHEKSLYQAFLTIHTEHLLHSAVAQEAPCVPGPLSNNICRILFPLNHLFLYPPLIQVSDHILHQRVLHWTLSLKHHSRIPLHHYSVLFFLYSNYYHLENILFAYFFTVCLLLLVFKLQKHGFHFACYCFFSD